MKPITTLGKARALPEKDGYIRYETIEHENGSKTIIPYFADIVSVDWDDKAILSFIDTDGRCMCIGYDSNGAYKYEVI